MRDSLLKLKHVGIALIATGGVVLATGAVVNAYPPLAPAVAVDDPTPPASGPVQATVTGCIVGETVDFELEGSTDSDTCAGSTGTASVVLAASVGGTAVGDLAAPGLPGEYTGTATLDESDTVLSFVITVAGDTAAPTPTTTVAPQLPATGSDSNNATTIAFGLLFAGAGLLGVAQLRRRQQPA